MDEDDGGEEIAQLEAQIEELAEGIESCRKIMLASKAVIAVGGILLVAIMVGAIRFDPMALTAAIATVLGGIVLFGSNRSTSQEKTAALKAAEAQRAELIDKIDLTMVGGPDGRSLPRPNWRPHDR
jgi:small neutral amino acid transporter SnatA (MarC family)